MLRLTFCEDARQTKSRNPARKIATCWSCRQECASRACPD